VIYKFKVLASYCHLEIFFFPKVVVEYIAFAFAKYFFKTCFWAQWTMSIQQTHINNQEIKQELKIHKNNKDIKQKIKTQKINEDSRLKLKTHKDPK
jgi:hypothetical protein